MKPTIAFELMRADYLKRGERESSTNSNGDICDFGQSVATFESFKATAILKFRDHEAVR